MLLCYRLSWGFCRQLPDDFRKVFGLLGSTKKQNFEILEKLARLYNPHDHQTFLNWERKEKLVSEFNKYLNGTGRKEKIATVAWSIMRLGLSKQSRQLLEEFADRIDNDQWYVTFEESVRAMEAFHWLQNTQFRDSLYEKIERNVEKTIWEVDMTYYERLSSALVKANRLKSPLWDKLQYHILNNLSMVYSPKTVLNIFLNFAVAGKGSNQLYYALQLTICRGHLFEKPYFLQGQVHHAYSSELMAKLFRVFAIASLTTGMTLTPEFSEYLLRIINHSQFRLQELGDVTTIVEHLKYFEYGEDIEREVQSLLLNRIKTIEGYLRLEDVIEFYEKMAFLGVQVPQRIVQELSEQVLRTIVSGPRRLHESLQVYSYFVRNGLTGNDQFAPRVDRWLEECWKYLTGEETALLTSVMGTLEKKIDFNKQGLRIGAREPPAPSLPT